MSRVVASTPQPPDAAAAAHWDAHVHVFDAGAPTQPGHYRPAHHPIERIEALAAAHGVGRLVLVQPSVYGTDNGVMLQALAQRPDWLFNHYLLAACQTAAGHGVDGRRTLEQARRFGPYPAEALQACHPFADAGRMAHYMDGLRRAGWKG